MTALAGERILAEWEEASKVTRADAVLAAGLELLTEYEGRLTSEQRTQLQATLTERVMDADDRDYDASVRRHNAQHWRQQVGPELSEAMLTTEAEAEVPYWRQALPELAEAMAAPANERWPAHTIASIASELNVHPDRIDFPSIAKEARAAMAYVAPATLIGHNDALHRQLGIHPDKPIPEARIKAATREPGDAGKRARLAMRVIEMGRRR